MLPSNLLFFPFKSYSFLPLLQELCRLRGSGYVSTSCRILLLPTCTSLQQFLNFGFILCLAYPELSLHHVRTSPCLSILLTISWPSKVSLSPFFQQVFWPCRSSSHYHVLTASSTSHASIFVGLSTPLCSMLRFLPFLIHESPFCFLLRLELFTVFPFLHQAVKAGLRTAGLACTSSLFLAALSLLSLPP